MNEDEGKFMFIRNCQPGRLKSRVCEVIISDEPVIADLIGDVENYTDPVILKLSLEEKITEIIVFKSTAVFLEGKNHS
jgi:hypothetical protein